MLVVPAMSTPLEGQGALNGLILCDPGFRKHPANRQINTSNTYATYRILCGDYGQINFALKMDENTFCDRKRYSWSRLPKLNKELAVSKLTPPTGYSVVVLSGGPGIFAGLVFVPVNRQGSPN